MNYFLINNQTNRIEIFILKYNIIINIFGEGGGRNQYIIRQIYS